MKLRASMRLRAGTTLVLALILGLGFAMNAPAQGIPPLGSYGILLNMWPQSGSTAQALIGVLNFDGAGNVIGSYTLVGASAGVLAGKLSGTYSSNPDGSGTVSLSLDVGVTNTLAFVITDGGSGLLITLTGGTGPGPGTVINGTGRIQSAQGTPPAGSFGYLVNQWPDANNAPLSFAGVINLDGAGNVRGTYTGVGQGLPGALTGTLTGTYTTNPDGTGTLIVTLDIGQPSTIAMVVTDGGLGIQLLQTSGTGVLSGAARKQ